MAGIVIAILAILGVSGAAQSSLPGGIFYPVKINMNEEIRAAFALSPEAKAAYEAQRAENRLSEAEAVSVKEHVDAQTRAQIEVNFKAFADRAQERITALQSVDARAAADLASNFESALRVHEKILARLAAKDKESKDEVGDLQKEVDSELKDSVKVRVDAEAEVKKEKGGPDAPTAAQGKLNAAANVIDEVTKFINDKKAALGADATAKAQATLNDAKVLLAQAQVKLQAKAYADAFMLGNSAIRTAQEAKQLIEAQDELDVDLNLDGRASASENHANPDTRGYMDSESHMGGGARGTVDIEVGF